MQPYFFPYIGYFQLIEAVDRFFLYDNLDYSKGGWISRNRILVVDREPTFLTIPILDRNATQTIREVQVESGTYWRQKILRSIEDNYRRAPYFERTLGLIQETLFLESSSLAEINKHSVLQVAQVLGIETEILTDSAPFEELEEQLRSNKHKAEKSQEPTAKERVPRRVVRALELCRRLDASIFVNPVGGEDLYDREVFEAAGFSVSFLESNASAYRQRSSRPEVFHPRLSIIDVLMNCGRDRTRAMLKEYRLV